MRDELKKRKRKTFSCLYINYESISTSLFLRNEIILSSQSEQKLRRENEWEDEEDALKFISLALRSEKPRKFKLQITLKQSISKVFTFPKFLLLARFTLACSLFCNRRIESSKSRVIFMFRTPPGYKKQASTLEHPNDCAAATSFSSFAFKKPLKQSLRKRRNKRL